MFFYIYSLHLIINFENAASLYDFLLSQIDFYCFYILIYFFWFLVFKNLSYRRCLRLEDFFIPLGNQGLWRSLTHFKVFNPFHATGLFLFPLKTSENQRFSDVLRGYRKRSVAWSGLTFSFLIFLGKKFF